MKLALLTLPVVLSLAGCQAGSRSIELIDLNGSVQPLRERFNADRGRLRVVALFSPV
jgi:hypothetical protein